MLRKACASTHVRCAFSLLWAVTCKPHSCAAPALCWWSTPFSPAEEKWCNVWHNAVCANHPTSESQYRWISIQPKNIDAMFSQCSLHRIESAIIWITTHEFFISWQRRTSENKPAVLENASARGAGFLRSCHSWSDIGCWWATHRKV